MTDAVVVNELKRIANQHSGILRALDVVASAQSPDSPLHDKFEWDDGEAAHQWRLQQARQLIRVTVSYIGTTQEQYRVFVSLSPDRINEGGGYRPVDVVLLDETFRQQLLSDALDEMQSFQEKYAHLKELSSVFVEMQRVQQQAKPRRKRGRLQLQPSA